jgi:hypothetical protein
MARALPEWKALLTTAGLPLHSRRDWMAILVLMRRSDVEDLSNGQVWLQSGLLLNGRAAVGATLFAAGSSRGPLCSFDRAILQPVRNSCLPAGMAAFAVGFCRSGEHPGV